MYGFYNCETGVFTPSWCMFLLWIHLRLEVLRSWGLRSVNVKLVSPYSFITLVWPYSFRRTIHVPTTSFCLKYGLGRIRGRVFCADDSTTPPFPLFPLFSHPQPPSGLSFVCRASRTVHIIHVSFRVAFLCERHRNQQREVKDDVIYKVYSTTL